MRSKLILIFVLITASMPLYAATTKYVIDQILITMRSGQGSQFQIIRTLPSGTELEILQTNEETGYSLARSVKSGAEGWVLTQYLRDTPIHRDQLAKAEKKIKLLEEENSRLKNSTSTIGKQSSELELEVKKLSKENSKMSKELARIRETAKQPLKIAEDNAKLRTESMAIDKEVSMLRQENQALKDRSAKEWMLAGAGILFVGVIFGLVLPKIRSARKSSWDSSL